jgi:hypothetical protein
MDATAYNEKLLFVADKGDLSTKGALYREYHDAFDEWYGDPIAEDVLNESGYPENDFREWFKSRVMDLDDEAAERDPEICIDHLEKEIKRIRELKTNLT